MSAFFMPSTYVEKIIQPGILDWSIDIPEPDDLIDLTVGQPDFEVLPQAAEAVYKAVNNGHNKYTDSQGVSELRKMILKEHFGVSECNFDVVVTNGVTSGIFLVLMTCLNKGDQILLTDPYFVQYKIISDIFHLDVNLIDTYPNFELTFEKFKKNVTSETKAIILNYPNNPTGCSIDDIEFEQIVKFCKKNNIIIIFDEIYNSFYYNKKIFNLEMRDNIIVLGGFSKNYCVTGWRLGYIIADKKIVMYLTELQAQMCQGVNSVCQYAMIDLLKYDMKEMYEEYYKRYLFIKENLDKKYDISNSQGGFFFFIKVPEHLKMSSTQFCCMMKKKGVLLVPGFVFSSKDTHFRLAICKPIKVLERAVKLLNDVL